MNLFSAFRGAASLLLCAGVAGCGLLSTGDPDTALGPGLPTQTVTVIEDPGRFDRSAIQDAPFEIEEVSIEEDTLALRVSYGGGCAEHTFQLFSTRGIYESTPPQADVYLSHDGKGDVCLAEIHEVLRFDLSPLRSAPSSGAVRLRIYSYEGTEPIRPLPLYEYR